MLNLLVKRLKAWITRLCIMLFSAQSLVVPELGLKQETQFSYCSLMTWSQTCAAFDDGNEADTLTQVQHNNDNVLIYITKFIYRSFKCMI